MEIITWFTGSSKDNKPGVIDTIGYHSIFEFNDMEFEVLKEHLDDIIKSETLQANECGYTLNPKRCVRISKDTKEEFQSALVEEYSKWIGLYLNSYKPFA